MLRSDFSFATLVATVLDSGLLLVTFPFFRSMVFCWLSMLVSTRCSSVTLSTDLSQRKLGAVLMRGLVGSGTASPLTILRALITRSVSVKTLSPIHDVNVREEVVEFRHLGAPERGVALACWMDDDHGFAVAALNFKFAVCCFAPHYRRRLHPARHGNIGMQTEAGKNHCTEQYN